METIIHQQNLFFLRMQLDETPDLTRRLMLLKLMAEEEAKNQSPRLEKHNDSDRSQDRGVAAG